VINSNRYGFDYRCNAQNQSRTYRTLLSFWNLCMSAGRIDVSETKVGPSALRNTGTGKTTD
jgi:hypothetical protein